MFYLETLHRSYKDIGLILNAKKTKWFLITPWNRTYEMELTINGERIDRVEQARYLGIELDTKLWYKNHAAKITTKSKQAIRALCRTLRKWAPKSTFKDSTIPQWNPSCSMALKHGIRPMPTYRTTSSVSKSTLHG